MEEARSAVDRRRRAWLPWVLLAGVVAVAGGGGVMASRSISSLLARNAQLEREALESEARVAELQVLRGSMERRLRLLEQQQTASMAQRELPASGPTPPPAPAKAEPVQGKAGKAAGRR